MWKRIAVGSAVAAAVIGVGTASLAVTGDNGSTPGSGTTTAAAPAAHAKARKHAGVVGRNTLHGQVVTQNPKTKQIVTHDLIRGSVTAVSPTSISVKAADNTTFTYTVNADTSVVTRTVGKPGSAKKAAIGDVKVGDTVAVAGTGTTSPYLAKHIVDGVA